MVPILTTLKVVILCVQAVSIEGGCGGLCGNAGFDTYSVLSSLLKAKFAGNRSPFGKHVGGHVHPGWSHETPEVAQLIDHPPGDVVDDDDLVRLIGGDPDLPALSPVL